MKWFGMLVKGELGTVYVRLWVLIEFNWMDVDWGLGEVVLNGRR